MNIPEDHSSPASHDYGAGNTLQPSDSQDFPGKNGHWNWKRTPIGPPPVLPENPTEQQRAAHQAADEKWQRQYYHISYTWMPDPKPEETLKTKSLATAERERPPMHPLPRRTSKPPKLNARKHESHCSVCRHPDRDAIEEEFIHWFSPRATAKDYDIDVRAIYRHAHAFNLFTLRNRKIRFVLSHALERAEHAAPPTAGDLNRIVRTFTRLTDDGEWIEPPSHVIVSSGRQVASAPNTPLPTPPPAGPAETIADASLESDTSPAPESREFAPSFSTRRARKTSPQPVENNENAPAFLDTQNQPSSSPKSPGGFTFARGPFPSRPFPSGPFPRLKT